MLLSVNLRQGFCQDKFYMARGVCFLAPRNLGTQIPLPQGGEGFFGISVGTAVRPGISPHREPIVAYGLRALYFAPAGVAVRPRGSPLP